MYSRALALILSAASLLLLAGSVYQPAEAEGRMLLYVKQVEGKYIIDSISIEQGAEPFPSAAGLGAYILRSDDGRIVATGQAHVRNRIYHDRSTGSGGELVGYSETVSDSFVVSIPYYSDAPLLECSLPDSPRAIAGDLRAVPRMRPALPPSLSKASAYTPQYMDYLRTLFPNGEYLLPEELKRTSDATTAAAKVPAHYKVEVNKLPAGGDGFIQVWIYKEKNGEWESAGYDYTVGFNQTHTLQLEPGFYRLHVMANAYKDIYHSYVRIGARKQDLFLRTGQTSASNPATLTVNYNYLTTVRVINDQGELVSARINVVDHVKKTKSMWSTVAADTIANGSTPTDVQFRLPAGAKVFVVYPWDYELYAETILVAKIDKNDDNLVTITVPSLKTVGGNALKQIWPASSAPSSPAAAKGKMNILFMSEAFTDGNEKFTDKNGNGVWDGDLLLDDNGNGKFDTKPQREIYIDRNFNGKYDAPEPFNDANGDGICNLYERAKFEFHCAFAAAALLNIQPFQKYSDRINIYTYWIPSKHGVQKITESNPWKNMETAFGSYCIGGGCNRTGKVDAQTVYAMAGAALPNYTVPIVVVRDPFVLMLSNASFNFGRVLLSATDSRSGTTLIHELGHSIGNLGDEYVSTGGQYTGGEPWEYNLTTQTDPKKVKWRRFIKGTIAVPTPLDYDGYGLFEGGSYGDKGLYRPTPTSMMRDTDYPYYRVNEQQLKKVLKKFKK